MDELILTLLKSGATGGVIAGILMLFAKKIINESSADRAQVITQMTNRITALEESSRLCEEDRKALHQNILDLARGKSLKFNSPNKAKPEKSI